MKRILIYFGDEQQKQPIVEQVLKDMHADYRILQDLISISVLPI